mgnify:CR=1 FL=1
MWGAVSLKEPTQNRFRECGIAVALDVRRREETPMKGSQLDVGSKCGQQFALY